MSYMKSYEIVAYTYQATIICGGCMVERLIADGKMSSGARGMKPQDALDQVLAANGITEEWDYDHSEYPKIVFVDQATSDDLCMDCGGEIL